MSSSPLTLAMLGGDTAGANMAMYDPATLAAMQKTGLARTLLNQGLDSSAAYPAQAISRLGQALIGGLMLKEGMGDLQDIGKQRSSDTADTLNYINEPENKLMVPQQPLSSAAPAPSALPPVVGDQATPFAANNPLNIRFAGQDGAANTKGFAAFPTPEAGAEATNKQFGLYADRGINTLRGLISRWAPPTENNTDAYITRVSKETGLDPDAPIDLRNPETSALLQKSMAGVEGNKNANVQYAQLGGGGGGGGGGDVSAPQPQIGVHAPNVAAGLEIMRRAQQAIIDPRNRYKPEVLDAAKMAVQRAQTLMGLDKFVSIPGQPGAQMNATTGEIKYGPVPRVFTDESGTSKAIGPGGQVTVVSPFDPEGARNKTLNTSAANLPIDPERQLQEIAKANAGRPSVEQKVMGEGAGTSFKLAAEAWNTQQQAVRDAAKREGQLQMFEQAMPAFDTGAAAPLRLKAQQALSELGFKNNAPAGELLQGLQRQIELANTPKGQGQITENERVLIREGANLFGSTPEGAQLLIGATRAVNNFDRQVLKIYTESAKKNGGTPNPVEVAEGLQNLPPPMPPALERQIMERIAASKGSAGPATAPMPAGVQTNDIEAEMRRRGLLK